MSPIARRSIAEAFLEYLITVLPVAFYVCLEAYHKQEARFICQSAEWAIATIFLMFQGAHLFIRHSISSERSVSITRATLLALLALTVVVVSAMNALDSMHNETDGKIAFRVILFAVTSFVFLILVSSSKYKNGSNKHG